MKTEEIRRNLSAIKEYVSGIKLVNKNPEVQQMESQLHELERTIRRMEKKGIQVLEGLTSGKTSLESKILEKKAIGDPSSLYEELLDIIAQLGRVLGRRPDRELYKRLKEYKRQVVGNSILRENIVIVLNEMGGSGHESDILKGVEVKLKGRFTPADKEKPHGSSFQWESNVRKERKRMIKDGILTPESRGGKWILAK
jgi:hypothetical protein